MESGSHISYTKTLEEQTLVYLSITPLNLSMMLVWNNLADPHLSAFSDFARFSRSLALKPVIHQNEKLRKGNSMVPGTKKFKLLIDSFFYWQNIDNC